MRDRSEGRASLGHWLAGSARGQGIAAEAHRAVVRWAVDDLRIARLQLYVEPSRGMPCHSGRLSVSALSGRVCCAVGSRWARSVET
ncbi:GNAT family N-acetyltransferase [Streptomyces sp. NPDC001401]|uniref:GNAT family N-acetyltransferase n=1 Tax=Streptomyces sp. NPDC001401 TaxID=3364570 RepID=UPI0036A00015